jgi:hypothetical protein
MSLTANQLHGLRACRDGHDRSQVVSSWKDDGTSTVFEPKDWRLTLVVDKGPGHFYRFHVEGVNLNVPDPDEYGHRIYWDVPTLDDYRYDLFDAVFVRAS